MSTNRDGNGHAATPHRGTAAAYLTHCDDCGVEVFLVAAGDVALLVDADEATKRAVGADPTAVLVAPLHRCPHAGRRSP